MFRMNGKANYVRQALAVSFVAVCGLAFVPQMKADEWNKKTAVTFSEPVELPGLALGAGTYTFKLMDSNANRNVVQVFNNDETQLLGTFLAIPDYRLKPHSRTVIQFEERPAGTPPAIMAWFYPGDEYGQQLVYPHQRAMELAKQNRQNVLSMPDELTGSMKTKSSSADDSGIQSLRKAKVTGVRPSGESLAAEDIVTSKPEIRSSK
jgi:hypothetical protein